MTAVAFAGVQSVVSLGGRRLQEAGDITTLLERWGRGDRSVEHRLFDLVLPKLHGLARMLMSRERPDHSLQATALLNEAYFALVRARLRDWQDRRHFYSIAARAMRRLLIDHARGRGSGAKVAIDDLAELLRGRDAELDQAVEIDRLLSEVERTHPEWCALVEMKFFAGFTDEETADALGIPLRSMQRSWGDVRRWLFERMGGPWPAKPNTTNS